MAGNKRKITIDRHKWEKLCHDLNLMEFDWDRMSDSGRSTMEGVYQQIQEIEKDNGHPIGITKT